MAGPISLPRVESFNPLNLFDSSPQPLPTRRGELTAQLNRETNEAINRIKPSVVSIYTKGKVVNPETGEVESKRIADGAGFAVKWENPSLLEKDELVVATNRHVIEYARTDPNFSLEVATSNIAPGGGVREEAVFSSVRILDVSPNADIAFVAIKTSKHPDVELPPVPFGSLHDVHDGYRVTAIGDPYGIKGTTDTGHVVNEGVQTITTEFGTYPVFQVDVSLRPGDSGGVIINLEDGKVVGVPNIQVNNDPSTGLAIPIDVVAEELKRAQEQPSTSLPTAPIAEPMQDFPFPQLDQPARIN